MFRKIVTELAYSPALAGNLGQYIKQLRDKTSRRQIGLIFLFLAVTVQLIATGLPPESANANNPGVFIDTELQSVNEYLEYYDQNTSNIRNLLTSLGISRPDIEAMSVVTPPKDPTVVSWSMQNKREPAATAHFFNATNGKTSVAYYTTVPSQLSDSPVYVGSAAGSTGWFAITKEGANLITEKPPTSACDAWLASPYSALIVDSSLSDQRCLEAVSPSLSVKTISPASPTPIQKLQASDRIAYTLSLTNKSDTSITVSPALNLEDILEYSRVLDYGGGSYDYDTKHVSWPLTVLEPGSNLARTFIMQLLPTIPATASGYYLQASYDCTAAISFGTTLATPVDCPAPKHVERITNTLPRTSTMHNLAATAGLLIIAVFLYLRSRQQLTELYIIRHNHLGGL